MKKFLLVFLFLLSTALNAQELHIRNIKIDGLKTTKEATVLRELSFSVGDKVTVQELHLLLEETEATYSISGFLTFVDFTHIIKKSEVDILLKVSERWYVWPILSSKYPSVTLMSFGIVYDTLTFRIFRESTMEFFSIGIISVGATNYSK